MHHSGFRALHPLPSFIYFTGVMLLSMLLLHPVFLTASALLLVAVGYRLAAFTSLLRTVGPLLALGVVLFVLNPLFSHRGEHILFYMWEQPITLEAVCFGLTIGLSTLSLMLVFLSYSKVMSSDKFLYLFASIWPKGSLVVVMGMRFVPLLKDRLRAISHTQQTKGIGITEGPLRKRASDGMKLLQILLTWSLEDALQTADSMKARGFGMRTRSTYRTYRMRSKDWRALTMLLLLLVTCLAGRLLAGYGQLTIYPSMEAWQLRGWEWCTFAAFITYIGMPLWMEGKDRLWNSWR
ncbi:energy-coupling factor transporter transmembrane component T [Paenibacillus sp. YYML68]|uniref:energy-coupling factor transporter transmembrane component T n=1 Tax=Paenibacillus sp. YYML68 TaxID=2909250 RepID=UPI00248F9DF8|nr:energy-coupling factor transporter transmembrane component T [Paenibacillus sp. YYML68]